MHMCHVLTIVSIEFLLVEFDYQQRDFFDWSFIIIAATKFWLIAREVFVVVYERDYRIESNRRERETERPFIFLFIYLFGRRKQERKKGRKESFNCFIFVILLHSFDSFVRFRSRFKQQEGSAKKTRPIFLIFSFSFFYFKINK